MKICVITSLYKPYAKGGAEKITENIVDGLDTGFDIIKKELIGIIDENGSWRYFFEYDSSKNSFTVPKGSITVNGVSLTVVDSEKGMFSVSIIPFTQMVTNFHNFKIGTIINIEFDVLGKYVQTLLDQYLSTQK